MSKKGIRPSKNQVRDQEEVASKKAKKKRSRRKIKLPKFELNLVKNIGGILDGSFLTREYVIRLLPFVFFLVLIAMIYISNSNVAQKRIRSIENLNKEIIELRNEHISAKSALMFYTKPSEISKQIKETGIKEAMEPPRKLIVKPLNKDKK